MITQSITINVPDLIWAVNPLEVIHSSWKELMEMNSEQAKLHLVGKAKLRGNVIVDLELSAVLYEKSFEMKFRDKDEIFFVLPFDAETGVEGAYLRIIEAIGEII